MAAAGVVVAAVSPGAGIRGPDRHRPHRPGSAQLAQHTLFVEGTEGERPDCASPEGRPPDILQIDAGDNGSADFSVRRAVVARIVVDARAGDDRVRIDESNGVFTDTIPTTLDGGDGNDKLAGGTGVEKLSGGPGNDTIDGNGGNDLALMGAGDDTFVWDPGDGSDTIEGQDRQRHHALQRRRRGRARRPLGQRQPAAVLPRPRCHHDGHHRRRDGRLQRARRRRRSHRQRPHGHRCPNVNADLAGTLGGITGDGATDTVVVNGTKVNDTIDVSGDAAGVAVSGLTTRVAIQHQDPTDALAVNGLDGDDAISAADSPPRRSP